MEKKIKMVIVGIEPTTNGLLDQRSTDWAMRPLWPKRQWCIGNIEASQALAPGSTPGWRTVLLYTQSWPSG